MYISDILSACSCCKNEQIQRFYHSTSLHRLTEKVLMELTLGVAQKIEQSCENCGTQLEESDVLATTMTFGFADDTGCIVGFRKGDQARFQVLKNRRLDPQVVPAFDFPDDAFSLDESKVEEKLERVLNPKLLWLELFAAIEEDPEGGAWAEASKDCIFYIDTDEEAHETLLYELSTQDNAVEETFEIALDSQPRDLWLKKAEDFFAPLESWLSAKTVDALLEGEIFATVIIRKQPIIDQIKRAFETAKLEYDFEHLTFNNIRTPTDLLFEGELNIVKVAERAVYTGLTPGECARLSAEEIVGNLLRIWR